MAAMSEHKGFPLEIQAVAARYEDRLGEFDKRDPARPRWDTLHHGEQAYNLLGDLIEALVVLRAELGRKVEDYREVVRRMKT